MKIVITGGHLSPALAVIEELNGEEIYYIGRKYSFEGDSALSLEYQEITKLNIPFFPISTARLQRKLTRYTFISLSKLPLGFTQSFRILKKIKPEVVLGFGGYVSLPVTVAAHLLKIPVVLHEQTLDAGFANKIASKFADKICISWESSQKYFPSEKTILTGNPIKKEIINIKKTKKKNQAKKIIYVTGGSTGSHFINNLIYENLDLLLKKYVIIHQTGDSKQYNDYEKLYDKKNKLNKLLSENYFLKKFLTSKEVSDTMEKSDLIIGRAGVNTVSELIYLEIPSLLIPIPFSQKNEQLKNAQFIKKLGLGEYIEQKNLNSSEFINTISYILENPDKYILKEKIVIENAAGKIVKVLKDVSKKKNS